MAAPEKNTCWKKKKKKKKIGNGLLSPNYSNLYIKQATNKSYQ